MAGKNAGKGKDAKDAEEVKAPAPTGQGRAVTLPNGELRINYIRNAYYHEDEAQRKTRSEIKNAINEMLKEADLEDSQIPYQIVFAATKTVEDPRVTAAKKVAAEAKPAAEAKK